MKQIVLLLSAAFFLNSCAKSNDTEPASTANFKITGLKDVDLSTTSNAWVSLPLSVVPLGSAKDTVLLSMDGFPKGMGYTVSPLSGATPYDAKLSLFTDFSGQGGTFPVKLRGVGRSGEVSYTINVTVPSYRGWIFDGILYRQTGFIRNTDSVKNYASVRIYGGGNGQLTVSFPKGRSFPKKTTSYSITSGALDSSDNIQISFYDNAKIFSATGKSTGTFLVDTLGKLVFKCSNVEMSNGLEKKFLSVDAAEQ